MEQIGGEWSLPVQYEKIQETYHQSRRSKNHFIDCGG